MNETLDIQLLRQCAHFLGNPLDLAHPTRVAELIAPFNPDTLRHCPAAWNRLGQFAAKSWQLKTKPAEINLTKAPIVDFLLASTEQTLIIADWLGTLTAYDVIRKTISGNVLRTLHEDCPHCFPAVHRQIIHFQTWLKQLTKTWPQDRELTPHNVRIQGLALLGNMFEKKLSQDIRDRWALQFPLPDWQEADRIQHEQANNAPTDLELLQKLRKRGLILC